MLHGFLMLLLPDLCESCGAAARRVVDEDRSCKVDVELCELTNEQFPIAFHAQQAASHAEDRSIGSEVIPGQAIWAYYV